MPNLSGSLAISGSLILFDGTNTVNFTATGSSASFTSSFANTSGCTNKVNIYSTASGDTSMHVTLVPDLSTGCQYTYVDQQLRYDAVSNLLYTTAEYALNATTATSASYVLNAVSSSFARTASIATSAITAQTASYVQTAQTASYAQNAQTASYVLNAVSSSFATTANNININSLNSSDTTVSLVMVPNQTTGSQSTIIDSKLYFNAADNVLTTDNLEVAANITSSGDLRFLVAGNAVVRPIIDLVPNGTASFNPNITTTTAYANYGINLITTASAQSNCFRLPQTPVKGKTVTVINNSGINVIAFPSVAGGEVNGIINGYVILPSDGKSYSFDCYENPLPGGWSLGNSPTPGITTISTGEINWAFTNTASSVIGYVNDSIKGLGGGLAAGAPSFGLDLPQYVAGNSSWTWQGTNYSMAYATLFPDTIPGTGVWKSIDSMQIQTNITGGLASSFYSTFAMGYVNELYYNPSNPNYSPSSTQPWAYQIYQSPSYATFNANVRNPWFAARPGTLGSYNGSGFLGNPQQTITEVIPGTFTPSQASPYTSDNIGDPGTLIFNLYGFPAYAGLLGLRMLGRNYIGSFYHPSEGLLDNWYITSISPFFATYAGAPFIPNIKFNTVFNVQI
jgi:hypothetical protein